MKALDGAIGHGRPMALLLNSPADQLKLNEGMKKVILLAGYLLNAP
jgi:hypothetical protein